MIRVWGAVRTAAGGIRAEVRDVASYTIGDVLPGDLRVFKCAVLDGDPDEKCSPGYDCRPGYVCAACQRAAKRWWYEWQHRADERVWQATRADLTRSDFYWSSGEWCGHRHSREDTALRCAVAKSWPAAVQFDGHGKRLAISRVTA